MLDPADPISSPSPTPRRRSLRRGAALLALTVVGLLPAAAGTPATAAAPVAEIALPGVVHVLDAVSVPGDAIYLARGPQVVRLVPGTDPQVIDLPGSLNARVLAVAPDDTVWFGGLGGSLGTIEPDGTVAAHALAEPNAWVVSMAFGNDGALWALTNTSGWNHLERGLPGGAMVEVTRPADGNYEVVARGGSGAVVLLGATDDTVTAGGTFTDLGGVPPGTIADVATIGTDLWVATTSSLARITAADAVTSWDLGSVKGGTPQAVGAGPGGTAWYSAARTDGYGSNLGDLGASGPAHETVLAPTPAGQSGFEASHLVADPSAERLWAVGLRSSEVRLVPVDLTKDLSQVTADDPGPQTFGVATTVSAHVDPWDDASPAPTGTVTFSANGITLGSAPVAADGSATTTVQPTWAGLPLVASYSGDADHAPARSNVRYRSVADATTVTTIAGPPKPWRPGPITFTVTVTSPTGALPTGTVDLGVQSVAVSGGLPTAIHTTVGPGPLSMTATFQGDLGFSQSTGKLGPTMVSWDTDEENYVVGAYTRLFGRYPDPSGRTYWAGKIRNGLSRDRFALAQVATSEYRRTLAKRTGLVPGSATVAQAKPVVDALATTSVRDLLAAYWADGMRVTSCKDTIAPTSAPPGTFTCWVKVIFHTFTGSASPDDLAYAQTFGNTPAGRAKLARILVYSDHAVNEVVTRAYGAYLGRTPDAGGLGYWTRKIQAGMREEGVEARVLGSDEFLRRTDLPPADR